MITRDRVAFIVVPSGYISAREFAHDCGYELFVPAIDGATTAIVAAEGSLSSRSDIERSAPLTRERLAFLLEEYSGADYGRELSRIHGTATIGDFVSMCAELLALHDRKEVANDEEDRYVLTLTNDSKRY